MATKRTMSIDLRSPICLEEEPEPVGDQAKSDFVRLVPAWLLNDARIIEDSLAFWHRLRALPPNVSAAQRARELCSVAYVGCELGGVSTVTLEHYPALRCRLGIFRCLVSPEHVHRRIAKRLTDFSRGLLETWSFENPGEKVLGMAFSLELPHFDLLRTRPVWRGSNNAYYWLTGYAPNGNQIRLTWFRHARVG